MVGVLICTHGSAGQELLKSAEMICGQQENCQTVKFTDGESLDQLEQELEQKITALSGKVICLTDLKGGTPFNTLVRILEKNPAIEIVTGVNIPMLLELLLNRDQLPLDDLIKMILEAGKSGIYHFQPTPAKDEDEEF